MFLSSYLASNINKSYVPSRFLFKLCSNQLTTLNLN